jgi:hypothetical protein
MADIIKYPKAGSSDTALAVDTSGNATIGGTITNAAQLVTTSGASGTLTPTSSVMIVTTGEAYAAALANPSAAGQRLTVIQAANFDLTIATAANVKQYGGGDIVLSQYHLVEYVALSTSVWIMLTNADGNS